MDETKKDAVAQSAPETTGVTESPRVEVPTTEAQTTVENANQPRELDDPKFQTDEERRAFQKMRLENKQLRDEIEGRRRNESAFAPFRTQVATPNLAQGLRVEDFTDPLTGEVNRPAYNAAQEAVKAQQVAQLAQQSVGEQIDEYQARQKHPELFADPEIEQEIADRWFAAKMRGEQTSISEVSERVAKRYQKAVSKAEKIGAEKALTEVTPKEQAALAASSQTSAPSRQASAIEDREQLRTQVRQGKDDALAALMKSVPYVNR